MKIKIVLVGMVLMMAVAARGAGTNDLAGALRNGLFEEQVDHNLEAAIATYQSVVTKFDTDRQLAATAAFRLGECYRTLGKTNEAVAQYARVVKDFPDQGTLVKLSQQSLVELRGGSSMGSAVSPENYGRMQALLTQSKAQSAEQQDRLAKLRTAYAEKEAMLGRLKELDLIRLRQQLPGITSDPLLIKYLEQLSDAEQDLVKKRVDVSPENPAYKSAEALVEDNEKRVDERIRGIIESMTTELAAMKAQIDQASVMSPEEQASQQEAQRNSPTGHSMVAQIRELGSQPVTDEEEQEITRIRAMIQNSPDLINAANRSEMPLILAAQKDYLQVARFLLEHGADVNRSNGTETPLVAAAENGHKKMVELLLENGAEVNAKTGERHRNPLNRAVAYDFQAVAEVLLAHGADPNLTESDNETPLERVATHGSVSLAELLVAHGANVNATNASGRTPLHVAAEHGNAKMVSFLLGKKAEVNAKDNRGQTPLFLGIKNPEVVKILLANGAEVNARDNNGETALAVAASGPVEIVKMLLEAKADANLTETDGNNQGWAPLHFAVGGGSLDSVEALLSHGANPNAVTGRYFAGGGIGWLEGTTPLMLAIANNQRPDVVGLLLRYKANPNLRDARHTFPLERAISWKRADIAEILLAGGANVNAKFDDYPNNGSPHSFWQTALVAAVQSGDKAVVEAMLAHNPDVNATTSSGSTALDWVRTNPDGAEIAEMLRAHGGLDNMPNYNAIKVSRPAQKFTETVLRKGTNDWNHYTLLELLAAHYGFISPTNGSGSNRGSYTFLDRLNNIDPGAIYMDKDSWVKEGALTFPNLEGIKIWRTTEIGTKAHEIDVNLAEMIQTGDCTKDVELEWGDVVEIPEMDHPIDTKWSGFTDQARMMFTNCLKRGVQLTVKGQTTNLVLVPQAAVRNYFNEVPGGRITRVAPSFFIGPVLIKSGLLRTSSDLTQVKVTRMDVQSGMKLEWMVDCSDANNEPDLWLRDGDMVEVGER